MFVLKQNVPDTLPESGLTSVHFKVWWNQMIAYVAQDSHSSKFMKDGQYSTWTPERDGHRIASLHADDLDYRALLRDQTALNWDDVTFQSKKQKNLLKEEPSYQNLSNMLWQCATTQNGMTMFKTQQAWCGFILSRLARFNPNPSRRPRHSINS